MFLALCQSTVCRLPVTIYSECAKISSNGFPRSNGTWLVSANQRSPRHDVTMAHQKPPILAYYGAGPCNFTISQNSVNINSITSVLGLNDGKICTLYPATSAFTLRWVLPKSHSIPNPKRGCAPALLRQILHFCTEGSKRDKTSQLMRAPSKPLSGWEVHLQPYNGTQ